MKLAAASLATFVCVITAVVACSGDSTSDDGDDSAAGSDSGGESGSSGSAGSSTGGRGGTGAGGTAGGGTTSTGGATTGGRGGTSPSGGDAGTAPTGGMAGTPTGGMAGTPTGGAGMGGGSGGGGRECETDEDCRLFGDCCNCMGVPAEFDPPGCDLVCIQSRCMADGIGTDEVTCSFGRCVIDRSCNHADATCNSDPEPCPNGGVRSVTDNGCWGPCLPPTECREVTDCSSCGSAVCVIHEPQIRTTGCVTPDSSCTKGNYCECLDACPTSGFVCMEAEDGVHCPCPVC